ncbi:MAG: sodium/solute symporter [Verrucomicrobiae bacterium]|nr:sodium/solute symporter [Verrucomicrobiae bacterium]
MPAPAVFLAQAANGLTTIDGVIIFFYLAATLALGTVIARYVKSSGDFLLAGKSLPFWAVGMSIVVSDIGAIDMVSGAGAAYRYGLAQANFDWIGSVPAMILVGFLFAPYFWRSGVCTLPEFLGRRYGNGVRWFQAVIWLGFLLSMLAVMLWASAVFLNTVVGWSIGTAIWVTVAVVGFYTVLGGLTAVVLTDVIQTVVMFVGAAALLALSFWKLGGWNNLVEAVSARGPEFANHFRLLLPNDAATPYPWSGILLGLGIVLSTAYFSSNQAVIQRVLGARSEWDAKASMVFAGFLKLFVPVLIMIPGIAAVALHPGLSNPDSAVPLLVRDLLPPGLTGLVFAAFFAALMSSVDSYLNSSTTILVSDGYQPAYQWIAGRPAGDLQCLWISRILTVALIVTAGFVAPVIERFETVYLAIQTLFSLFQGPTLAVLILGIFWRRTNGWGAISGLVLGVCFSGSLSLVGGSLFPSEDPFLFVAFWAFVFALVVTVGVSLVTPPPSPERIRGLVFGEVLHDATTQALLAERAARTDPQPP